MIFQKYDTILVTSTNFQLLTCTSQSIHGREDIRVRSSGGHLTWQTTVGNSNHIPVIKGPIDVHGCIVEGTASDMATKKTRNASTLSTLLIHKEPIYILPIGV